MTPAGGASGGRMRSAGSANGILTLSMLLWAAGFPSAEILLEAWDPLALTTARLALAVSVLLTVWALQEGLRAPMSAHWGRGVAVGGIGVFLMLAGQALSDPISVAIIATTMPIVGAALEVFLDGRRLTWSLTLGIALALAGGVATSGAQMTDGAYGVGALLALLSVVAFAWASRAAVRELAAQSPMGRTTITLAGGLVFCSILFSVATWIGFSGPPSAPLDQIGWAHLALYALGAMALSQLFWLIGVARLGIALAAIYINAAPFFVMGLFSLLGADWRWDQAAGAALVALGALIAQRPSRAPAEDRSAASP